MQVQVHWDSSLSMLTVLLKIIVFNRKERQINKQCQGEQRPWSVLRTAFRRQWLGFPCLWSCLLIAPKCIVTDGHIFARSRKRWILWLRNNSFFSSWTTGRKWSFWEMATGLQASFFPKKMKWTLCQPHHIQPLLYVNLGRNVRDSVLDLWTWKSLVIL